MFGVSNIRPQIAVIDDDDGTRHMLSELLTREGYVATAFADATEALRVLRAGPAPDLILLDLRMPGMNGWEFRIEQLKDCALASTPVIVLSADESPQARAIHVDAFFVKPPFADDLLATVRRLLDQRAEAHRWSHHLVFGRMASLGALAAGMGDEIDNPLARVVSNIHLIRAELGRIAHDPPALARKPVSEIDGLLRDALDGALQIEHIVRDVRMVSSVNDGPPRPIGINAVLEAAVNVASSIIQSRARVLRGFGMVPCVLGDQGRLGQALLHLPINAAQAIGDAHDDGQIRVATWTSACGEALVSVSDNGEGIRPEDLGRIFDPLFTTEPASAGRGLGLSACRGIVASMGGTITVESQLGVGTTFILTFPPAARADARRSEIRAVTRSLRVLLIEDEPATARALARVLRRDHEVSIATGGVNGVALALEQDFDVVLCDLLMSDLGGACVLARLREARPGLERRILFVTGASVTAREREFMTRIENIVLEKPVERADLLRGIDETMARVRDNVLPFARPMAVVGPER